MQPFDQFCSPFLRRVLDDESDRPSSGCFQCRDSTAIADDEKGTTDAFEPGEVLLLGEEGVPMTGCWGLDLEFQPRVLQDSSGSDVTSFHCLVKSYAGDGIVARMQPADSKVVFFVAPKNAFSEQGEANARLQQVFEQMDPSRYLCEVDLHVDPDAEPSWYRLLIVGESTQTASDDLGADLDWDADQTMMEAPSFFNPVTPGDVELAPLLGTSMVRAALGSPASSVASLRTPLASPNLTPGGGAMKQMAALSERLGGGSFTLTPGLPSARQRPSLMAQGATPGTPGQSRGKTRTRSRRLSICNPELTPRTVTPGQARPKTRARSRRLSMCNPESPAESDGWSDDEELERDFSGASAQKLHVYLLKTGVSSTCEDVTDSVLTENVWTGLFNFVDCYALGNHYDAVCCRADGCINWSAGGLRNFKLFGMGQQFMSELDSNISHRLDWLLKAIDLAESHREGRCMHDAASAEGIDVHLAEEDEPSPMGKSRSRSNIRLMTPRGRPMRMSSRFMLSPRSPRSPFPRITTPSAVVSPVGGASPVRSVQPQQTKSSYQTLADKLKNAHQDSKEEKEADVANEINKQPQGSLLWMKYKLVKRGTSVSFVEPGDDKSRLQKCPGYAWKNIWERDMSPDFPLSNGIVYREDIDFLEDKSRRTQRLVRAANEALDEDYLQNKKSVGFNVANEDEDVLIDGAKFFLLRGEIAKRDPGLNSMFTGKQVKHASKAVQRQLRVDTAALQSILAYFLLPPRAFFQLLGDMKRNCCARRKHAAVDASSYNVATRSIMTYMFRTEKWSPRTRVMLCTMTLWLCCIVPLCVYFVWQSTKTSIHGIEIFVNTSYYLWAVLCISTVVASDVRGIPGHVSYKQASLKAEIASKPCSMTKISDGMPLTTSAMAIVQMVCRQHQGDDEEDEEEEGEEEEAGMDFSSKLLRLFWKQDSASDSLPWLQCQMQHDELLSSMSKAQLNRMLVFEFQLKDPPRDMNDSLFNLNIAVQGVQSKIDTGRPKLRAKITVCLLAFVHGFLGLLHRTAFRQQNALGNEIEEHASAIATCICTTVASYVVYSVLLRTGLKWWMVHLFLKQTHSAILVEEAITNHLPCYMDLRNQGNLDSWYSARQYLQEETNAECFAHKDQLPIAIAMFMCAGLSVNALTTYFADAGSVDFSAAPGILISLFNLVVIGVLLLIPLMALEKINMETSVLLRKMNQVAVELGKSLEENVDERFREEQRATSSASTTASASASSSAAMAAQQAAEVAHAAAVQATGATEHELSELRGRIADMDAVVVELQIREKLMMEQQFLLSIVQELRDTKSSKKIFGFAVDRNMLTKIFAGIGTCIYIIIKEYFTALLPGLSSAAATNATAGG